MDAEKILRKANELGHLLRQSEVVQRYLQLGQKVESNPAAASLLDDFIAATTQLQEMEMAGVPITDEQKLEYQKLAEKVEGDNLLREFLASQAYYMNMMHQVNQVISNPQGEPPRDSNIIVPGAGSEKRLIIP